MARIRSIKPEFFTSEDVAALSMFERVLFVGLWTYCDDEGRGNADPRLVRAGLFPLDDDVTVSMVAEAINTLHRRGQVVLYEASGKSPEASGTRRYLAVTHWEHQKISHPSPSKLPAPDDPASHLLTPHSGNSPEASVSPPESLRPDQGSGIREGNRELTAEPVSLNTAIEVIDPKGAMRQEDLWQALGHELGDAKTSTEKNIRGKTRRELDTIGATPRDVHERCAEYRRRFTGMALTDSALLKHWSSLAEAKVLAGSMNTGTAALARLIQRNQGAAS